MAEEKVQITEVWEYDKESKTATKLVGIFANGVPINIADGIFVERFEMPREEAKNKFLPLNPKQN